MRVSPPNVQDFFAKLQNIGLEAHLGRVQKQLDTGYNIISLRDKQSPHQADFIIETRGRVERQKGSFFGLPAYYQTPEYLILSKLRMIKATRPRERSLKDREDVQAVIASTRVDMGKLLKAAKREGTLEIINSLLQKSNRRKKPRSMFGSNTKLRRFSSRKEAGLHDL